MIPIAASLVALLYLKRAIHIYRGLFEAARSTYGIKTASACRRGFLCRAAMWAIPLKLYHWKQILWWKKLEEAE